MRYRKTLPYLLSTLLSSHIVLANGHIEELVVTEGKYLSFDKLNSVKTPVPIIDVPQSLSIVTSEQIKNQAFRNVGDVLRYTPGLSISQGEGHRDAIIIRGVQTTADFFIDGIRDDVQYFRPLYNVDQVEVLRGANALLFGRGGGGGVINRVIKQADLDASFNTIDIGVDSFGSYSLAGDANISLNQDMALRVNAYYQSLDNHRDFYEGDSFAINPTLTWDLGSSTTSILSYEYIDDDRIVDRGVPSVDNGNASIPNAPLEGFDDTFFGSADANATTLQAHIFRARVKHSFNDNVRGNITVQYADYDKQYQNLFPSDSVTLVNGVFADVELDGYRDTTTRQNFIIQGNLVSEFATGSIGHTLLTGFEYGHQDTDNARVDNLFQANNSCLVADDQCRFTFANPLVIPVFSFDNNPSRDRQSDVQFLSLYLQDQINITNQFNVVLGLRYDEFDIEVFDAIEQNDSDAIDGNFSRVDQEVSPRLGAIYKPSENISLYLSYSETFLPRSGEQFLTLNLDTESTRPQSFKNTEVGFKWDFAADVSLTAAVFRLERESFTSIDPQDAAQDIVISGSENTGFELQFTGHLTEQWSLNAGYAFLDGEVQRVDGRGVDNSGDDGNRTRQTPENMFSLWSGYQLNEQLNISLGLTYQDDFFVREDNNVEVPGYTRVDAGVFYDINDSTTIQLNIENLFNTDYFPDAHSNNNISTGEPLNARLSITTNF